MELGFPIFSSISSSSDSTGSSRNGRRSSHVQVPQILVSVHNQPTSRPSPCGASLPLPPLFGSSSFRYKPDAGIMASKKKGDFASRHKDFRAELFGEQLQMALLL